MKNEKPYYYESITDEDRYTFELSNEYKKLKTSFTRTIKWIRCRCTEGGTEIGGKRTLSDGGSKPLLEVKVDNNQGLFIKLIIRKRDVYIIGFILTDGRRCAFNQFKISGFSHVNHDGMYSGSTLDDLKLGLLHMNTAIFTLNKEKAHESLKALITIETFFLQISESARYNLFMELVVKSMKKSSIEYPLQRNEVRKITFVGIEGEEVEDVADSMKEQFKPDFTASSETSPYLSNIVQSYSFLCEAYVTYIFSDKKVSFLPPETVSECGIASTETLYNILGVLGDMNFDNLLKILKGKVGKTGFTLEDHTALSVRVQKLKKGFRKCM